MLDQRYLQIFNDATVGAACGMWGPAPNVQKTAYGAGRYWGDLGISAAQPEGWEINPPRQLPDEDEPEDVEDEEEAEEEETIRTYLMEGYLEEGRRRTDGHVVDAALPLELECERIALCLWLLLRQQNVHAHFQFDVLPDAGCHRSGP